MNQNMTFPTECFLRIQKEIAIDAPVAIAFEALLEQLGPGTEMPDGTPMPMKIEPWPGGRWFRDLGNNSGHLWGHVQVIKPPKLIEISGPMAMSYPVIAMVCRRDGNIIWKEFACLPNAAMVPSPTADSIIKKH